ncbi:MAG TPA: HAD-IIB family hydrolase [Kofleriaceae bacterium]|nr:HAD-IIB family hydrolase [Kofleriaceae bacterium]
MRYHVLAADYDGTLAHHGRIDDATWAALRRLRESGRKAVMVTGRQLEELLPLLEETGDPALFSRIVAENGAVIYEPTTKEVRALAEPPPPRFAELLAARGVDRVAHGHVIVASWEPHQDTILGVIRDLGLELQVIFNKGAVMVLPSGVNKATGLAAALAELGLSPHNAIGIGDAENDHALLVACECGVAVANALPALQDKADLVTAGDHGRGVTELIDRVLADDLAPLGDRLRRHHLELGATDAGPIAIDPYRSNLMVCGTSGSGKSTLTTSLLERLAKAGYQFAIIDPEGDYAELAEAVVLGAQSREPLVEEVLDVLRDAKRNVVANLLGVAVEHRPEHFARLMPALAELRTRTGRPHWLIVDEAHHMLPAAWQPVGDTGALREHGTIYVTVHPGSVAPAILETIDTLLAVGERPADTLAELCHSARIAMPAVDAPDRLPAGQALYWRLGTPRAEILRFERPKQERTRHSRKYVEGNLGTARSFFFRGPDGKLNLKAHNLLMFVQIADGVDEATWEFHRARGDYARWLRDEVKDDQLADEIAAIERSDLPPTAARDEVRAAVDRRYTLPVDAPSGIVDPPRAQAGVR